jgi:pheromone shutdown protein TraB
VEADIGLQRLVLRHVVAGLVQYLFQGVQRRLGRPLGGKLGELRLDRLA